MKRKLIHPALFQDHSRLPDYLDVDRRRQIDLIMRQSHILLISCLFWRMNIREVIPHRTLSDSLLYVPVKGSIRCRIGDERATVGPGQFMLVAEGVEHEAQLAEDCDLLEAYAIHCHAHTNRGIPLFSVFSSVIGTAEPAGFWVEQFRLLTHLMGTDAELGHRVGALLIRNLLVQQVLAGKPLKEVPAADDPRPWNAVYTMLRAFPKSPAVSELARQAGLSVVQFRRIFRAQTGKFPKAYMLQMRLDKARALLQSDARLTIKQIAEQTGFSDPHVMHAAFQRAYGRTPGACRGIEPAPGEV